MLPPSGGHTAYYIVRCSSPDGRTWCAKSSTAPETLPRPAGHKCATRHALWSRAVYHRGIAKRFSEFAEFRRKLLEELPMLEVWPAGPSNPSRGTIIFVAPNDVIHRARMAGRGASVPAKGAQARLLPTRAAAAAPCGPYALYAIRA